MKYCYKDFDDDLLYCICNFEGFTSLKRLEMAWLRASSLRFMYRKTTNWDITATKW